MRRRESRLLKPYVPCVLTMILFSISGCYTYKGPQYAPNLQLPKNSTPIPVKVRFDLLADHSPAADRESGYMQGSGSSATSKGTLKGELADLVTASLRGEFQQAHVFESLEADQAAPNLVLTGGIHRFYERTTEPIISICCGLIGAFIGLPLLIEEGEVDLELTLSTPEGKVVKTYRKRAEFNKWMTGYDGRAYQQYSHGFYLDRTFSEVATQLRDSILNDRELLVGAKGRP